jgi:hypothetical protein
MRLVHYIVVVCLFTASWDLIAVIHLGGSLRLTQILAVLICFAALAHMAQTGRILWPRGGTALALWIFGQALMLPLSGGFNLALELFLLLCSNVAITFALLQLYGEHSRVENLMKAYMASFVFVAIFGMLQIGLPLVGGPGILIRQWIVHGRIARISGFNYEPSYFATYMIAGWIMLVDLRLTGARIAAGRRWQWATYLVGLVLILSTSKLGWLFMLLDALLRFLTVARRFLQHNSGTLRRGSLRIPLPSARRILAISAVFLVCFFALRAVFSVVSPLTFLNGTGLGGTAAHSINDRTRQTATTWQIFLKHPWIGHSLGGVSIEIGGLSGMAVTDINALHYNWGFPVILDVLAGSGILFFIPFMVFLYSTTFGASRFARSRWPDERAKSHDLRVAPSLFRSEHLAQLPLVPLRDDLYGVLRA